MSRYSGWPRWMLLTKAGILLAFLPVYAYLLSCQIAAHHYTGQLDRYDDAALEISESWPELKNFDEYHKCMAYRDLAAGRAAIDHEPFDLWWMIRNWNTDFLAQQPTCKEAR